MSAPNPPTVPTKVPSGEPKRYSPDEHLFNQLLVGLASAQTTRSGIHTLSPATARDIVKAARALTDALIEEKK